MLKPLILASQSPRRIDILHRLHFTFDVIPAHIDEISSTKTLTPTEIATQNAHNKAFYIGQKNLTSYIIGCDTIVFCNQTLLGKPKSSQENFDMLKLLSNNTHYVLSGICIYRNDLPIKILNVDQTEITFNLLSDTMINDYIQTQNPEDKAGGYGLQDIPSSFLKSIIGSRDNVIGFPSELFLSIIEGL